MENERTIIIFSQETEKDDDGAMGVFDFGKKSVKKMMQSTEVSLDIFSKSLSDVAQNVLDSLENITNRGSAYILDEVEFKLDISAEGTIGIASVGGTTGITLKFKKKTERSAK